MYVAQCDVVTNQVLAVVELDEPVEPAPTGKFYVVIDGLHDYGGKYYYDGDFHSTPKT